MKWPSASGRHTRRRMNMGKVLDPCSFNLICLFFFVEKRTKNDLLNLEPFINAPFHGKNHDFVAGGRRVNLSEPVGEFYAAPPPADLLLFCID